LKNEELKKKVRMITQSEKLETDSNASDENKGTFITGTKVGKA